MNLTPVYRQSSSRPPLPSWVMNVGAFVVILFGVPAMIVAFYFGWIK